MCPDDCAVDSGCLHFHNLGSKILISRIMAFCYQCNSVFIAVLLNHSQCSCSKIIIIIKKSDFGASKRIDCIINGCLREDRIGRASPEQIRIIQIRNIRRRTTCQKRNSQALHCIRYCNCVRTSMRSYNTYHTLRSKFLHTGHCHILHRLVICNRQFHLFAKDTACRVHLIYCQLHALIHSLSIKRIITSYHGNKADFYRVAIRRHFTARRIISTFLSF